jgi:hypothetical protein
MLPALPAMIFFALAAAPATAATGHAGLAASAPCEPEKVGPAGEAAAPCEVEGDVARLAAELLVVKFGAGATEFAAVRATRYAAEDDPKSAEFWSGVAGIAAEILKSQNAAGQLPAILSK